MEKHNIAQYCRPRYCLRGLSNTYNIGTMFFQDFPQGHQVQDLSTVNYITNLELRTIFSLTFIQLARTGYHIIILFR